MLASESFSLFHHVCEQSEHVLLSEALQAFINQSIKFKLLICNKNNIGASTATIRYCRPIRRFNIAKYQSILARKKVLDCLKHPVHFYFRLAPSLSCGAASSPSPHGGSAGRFHRKSNKTFLIRFPNISKVCDTSIVSVKIFPPSNYFQVFPLNFDIEKEKFVCVRKTKNLSQAYFGHREVTFCPTISIPLSQPERGPLFFRLYLKKKKWSLSFPSHPHFLFEPPKNKALNYAMLGLISLEVSKLFCLFNNPRLKKLLSRAASPALLHTLSLSPLSHSHNNLEGPPNKGPRLMYAREGSLSNMYISYISSAQVL